MNTYIIILAYIFVIMIVGYVVNNMASQLVFNWLYLLLIRPGIILHELAHAAACFITGARVKKIDLFGSHGGEVVHTKARIPFVGDILISLAPIVVALVVIYYLPNYIDFVKIPNINMSVLSNPMQAISEIFSITQKSINLGSWEFWLGFYIIFNLVTTMAPSGKDIRNIIWDLLILGGIFYLLFDILKLGVDLSPIFPFLVLSLGYALLVLAVVIILNIILRRL